MAALSPTFEKALREIWADHFTRLARDLRSGRLTLREVADQLSEIEDHIVRQLAKTRDD